MCAEAALMEAFQVPAVPLDEGRWFSGGVWARKPEEKMSLLSSPEWMMGRFWERDTRPKKDCWGKCDYPSECRWGKQFGVQDEVGPAATTVKNGKVTTVPSSPTLTTTVERTGEDQTSNPEPQAATTKASTSRTFDDILLTIQDPSSSSNYLEPLTPSKKSQSKTLTPTEEKTTLPSMKDLLESSKRRKRKSMSGIPLVPSPLGANPPAEEVRIGMERNGREERLLEKKISVGGRAGGFDEVEVKVEVRKGLGIREWWRG